MCTHIRSGCRMLLLLALLLAVGAGSSATPASVEHTVSIGGTMGALVRRNTDVFINEGTALMVYDISDPAHPRRRAALPYLASMTDMALVSDTLYAVHSSISIFTLTDSPQPRLHGRYTGNLNYRALAVDGSLAAVTGAPKEPYAGVINIDLLDVRTAVAPQRLATLQLSNEIRGVDLADGFLYVITSAGVHIIDVRDPEQPVLRGWYATTTAWGVQVAGRYAYLAGLQFQILDVHDPDAPVRLSSYAVNSSRLQVEAQYVYLSGLTILDVTRPHAPVRVSSYPLTGAEADLDVHAGYALLSGTSGLHILDVRNPRSPALISSTRTIGDAAAVRGAGKRTYVVDRATEGTPAAPVLRVFESTSAILLGTYRLREYAQIGLVDADQAYLLVGRQLQLLDVRNPQRIVQQGSYTPAGTGGVTFIAIAPPLVYLHLPTSTHTAAIEIVDLSNPAAPRRVGQVAIPYPAQVTVVGPRIYVLDQARIQIIDIADPTRPQMRGALRLPQQLTAQQTRVFDVADGTALIGTTGSEPLTSRLFVIDVRNADRPVLHGTFAMEGFSVTGLRVVGEQAHLVGTREAIRRYHHSYMLIDLRQRATPQLRGQTSLGWADSPLRTVQVTSNAVYCAGATSISVVDVRMPEQPQVLASISLPQRFTDLHIIEEQDAAALAAPQPIRDTMYIAHGTGGVQIFYVRTGRRISRTMLPIVSRVPTG